MEGPDEPSDEEEEDIEDVEDEEEEEEEGDENEEGGEEEENDSTKKKKAIKNPSSSVKVLAGGAASYVIPPVRPKPQRPVDSDSGVRITQQKQIGRAWAEGPRIDLMHLGYVQEDYERRQEAVANIRERMMLKSRPGYQLRVRMRWNCQSLSRLILRRHFLWLPCVVSSLPEAVLDGDILQVHTHLMQRADVNMRDLMTGQLALNIAIQQQHEPIARLLIDRGADVNQQDDVSLLAPVHNAIIMGNKALFRRLLKAGADVDLADREGFTPLHWASVRGYLEIVAQLVEISGADINRQDSMGWTPLHIACFKGFPDLVEYLLVERKARADIEDCNGFTPLMFARVAENMDIVKRLDDFAVQEEAKRLRKTATGKKKKTKRGLSSPKKMFLSSKN
ncbi:Serine/threonine-protein kinase TNNI3K [Phytophthora citrophthora]|uniref:Serine/threonine-protein kinase TNNI3K n=1 Tax=Phytophthora citrophthora TaxID=4793 RepID=A0AAD9H1B3_9STRA|nr:Serine/threonine-protein kinase TNNI3K [Phytophthora citrophthora]